MCLPSLWQPKPVWRILLVPVDPQRHGAQGPAFYAQRRKRGFITPVVSISGLMPTSERHATPSATEYSKWDVSYQVPTEQGVSYMNNEMYMSNVWEASETQREDKTFNQSINQLTLIKPPNLDSIFTTLA
ncbi:hypothetical protein N7463_010334 [Penicillium fimorum]|uniref:Uncharacterized protein n=1 Tax=Penicillium fimorum TaxID=1882269 RepID=A0A9W9XJP0_9EURO|nr:hypothetical protein N7463_010334 [Penicillium fimorum]